MLHAVGRRAPSQIKEFEQEGPPRIPLDESNLLGKHDRLPSLYSKFLFLAHFRLCAVAFFFDALFCVCFAFLGHDEMAAFLFTCH